MPAGKTVRIKRSAIAQAKSKYGKSITAKRVQKIVKKAIKGAGETKYVANVYADSTNVLAPSWQAPPNLNNLTGYLPALPALTAGTGDYQRVGAKVLPTSLKVNLTFGFRSTDISCNELIVVVYYGTTKAGKTWETATPIQSVADLLDRGDGTNQGFAGYKSNLLLPINKHMNNAKRMMFRIAKTSGTLNNNGIVGPDGAFSTSGGNSFVQKTLTFKPPKALQYDNIGNLWPSNYAPWYAVSFCRADDIATDPVRDANLLSVSSRCHMYYKDI